MASDNSTDDILKGVKKGNPLLRNHTKNFKPQQSFEFSNSNDHKTLKTKFKNQKKSIKISTETKTQLDILKEIESMKFDYEIIQLLLDSYVNELNPEERSIYETMLKFRSQR
ncbi:MAG: hypothetical protein ABF855_11090 [Liquorilactobacillus satsumensis]|jgi:hypothetical protein|uniref:hypothetical protein n=1 Tax=Lactobacillaceae TaxID=33958 RepID=UPI0006D1C75B|nr:hypothetical protein [Lentilactobacillus parafarraginis]